MPIILTGMIHTTGESDVGKTTFALECGAAPERIAFFDSDVKGRSTAQDLAEAGFPFGAYHDLVSLSRGKRELEFHEMCRDLIDAIKPNEFDAIIWDTWSRFAKTCHPYVVAHPSNFREKWATMGAIKGAQQWLSSFDYEAALIAHLCSISRLVILTSHLKPARRGNARIPGKFTPDCSRAVIRKARMRLWLRRNPDSPQPIGLVLKRLSIPSVTDDGIRAINVLPLRMKPCTWDTIAKYLANPIGTRQPTTEETPSAFELSLLEGTLTADQERTFQLMLRQGVLGEVEKNEEKQSKTPLPMAQTVHPTTWQELLERSGKGVPDLGGIAAANAMSGEDIRKKWEEWRKEAT